MADTETAPATVADGTTRTRPEKPDQAKFVEDLKKAEEARKVSMEKLKACQAKLDSARGNKDSPGDERRKELIAEQNAIRDQQKSGKTGRTAQQERYKQGEEQIKTLIQQQNDARAKMSFKSVEELDVKIASLEKQVDSGSMTIVNERKALAEASNLKKQRKAFSGSDEIQKRIDQKKAENAELKKTFDSKEARELSDKYERNHKELDELKAAKEGTNKSFTALRAEKDKLYDDQKATSAKIREIKDAYYQGKKAFKEYEDMIYQQKRDRQKAEHNAYLKEKRSKDAQRRLEDASEPAYLDEIKTAKGLIYHFDPSSANKGNVKEPGALAASAQRTVDEPEMKGMKVMKKDEEDFFVGGGGKKKGKGGKKAAGATGSKFNIDPGTIESFGRVGVDPPTSQGDVPSVVEKLKEKLAQWENTQDEHTKKNIASAQAEIDRQEKEAVEAPASSSVPKADTRRRNDRAKKVPAKDAGTNGDMPAEAEVNQEKDTTADVADDMKKKASIEAKEDAVEA